MKCPVCREPDLHIADRQGIEVDYCLECRGVWLDRGELEKLMERAGAETADATAYREAALSREGSYHGGEDYRRPRRRKSLLRDILDFD